MRHFTRFQPQGPHFLLNSRVWMMETLMLDGFQRVAVERDSQHEPEKSHLCLPGQEIRKLRPLAV